VEAAGRVVEEARGLAPTAAGEVHSFREHGGGRGASASDADGASLWGIEASWSEILCISLSRYLKLLVAAD
jgi:hypothetical protein